jgi:antitoxin VapB
MGDIAKLFTNGRSQAVRLPAAYRFDGTEVFIRKDPDTGDVILSDKPGTWDHFLALLETTEVPADFLGTQERGQPDTRPDPFEGWHE